MGDFTDIMPRAVSLQQAMKGSDKAKSTATIMLSVAEACAYLRISKWTLYRQIQCKQLKSVKIGSRRLIPMHSFLRFIEYLETEAGT